MNEYLNCLKKYAVFARRARRREYWMFVLFGFLIFPVLAFVPQQQITCPIWAPPDPTVAAVNRLCADNVRLVNELNAKIGQVNTDKSEAQRTTEFLNSVYGEKDPEKLRQMARNWEAIGRRADADTQRLLKDRERMAWAERNRADQEFRESTGREFSQTVRPSTPGACQDAWDRCNRTHQIWDN